MENEKLNKEGRATIELMVADGIISKECAEKYFPELKESEGENIRKEMLDYCHKRMNNEFTTITIHQVERWLSWLEKQGEQKPVWSEEDEKILNLIIARLHSHPNVEVEEYGKDYHWLNSLENRVQPQQEWSKEDNDMMRNIIDDIYCGTNFNPEVRHAANERVKWFKSICLKYQSR